jgi:hypothetical protein
MQVIVGKSLQVAADLKKPAQPADPIKIDLSGRDNPVYGKKVTIEQLNNFLMLAEVEVWGKFDFVFTLSVHSRRFSNVSNFNVSNLRVAVKSLSHSAALST